MFEHYGSNVKFKDVRAGQSFVADGAMYIKLATSDRSDNYNAREVSQKRYATFQPNDIVAVYSKPLVQGRIV